MSTLPTIVGCTLERLVGAGAQSQVYAARHGEQQVAVKLFSLRSNDASDRTAFRREAAVLARLRHPGLPAIHEIGFADGRGYLVMDFIEGRTLQDELRTGPMAIERIVTIARSLAGVLAAVHRGGQLHRDLKPANVMLAADGRCMLIDFGLATEAQASGQSSFIGSATYVSPEGSGLAKRGVDARSDLYSLGIVLFELVAGAPPFAGTDIGELLRKHAVERPPSLAALRPSCPRALDAIIAKLIAKEPDERYQSAESLLADLDDLAAIEGALVRGDPPALGTRFKLAVAAGDVPLVGRQTERRVVLEAFDRAASGRGSLLLVEGETGSGKSRLLRELSARAAEADAFVLAGKAIDGDPRPLAPLRQAIAAFVRQLAHAAPAEVALRTDALRKAAGEAALLLTRFSPALGPLLGVDPRTAGSVDAGEGYFGVISDFFIALARAGRPVVLLIDDVQWLDPASLEVLRNVSANIDRARIVVACSARSEENARAGRDLFLTTIGEKLISRITLRLLEGDAVGELVRAQLGGNPLDATAVEQIASRTRGNPLAVGEFLRSMLEQGVLEPFWGNWRVDVSGLARLELSRDVNELLARRVDALTREARDVLIAAALVGNRFSVELVATASPHARDVTLAAVDVGVHLGLIEPELHGEYAFVHDKIREALLAASAADQRRDLHQRIADAFDARGTTGADDVISHAHHAALGHAERNPQKVFALNLAAARASQADFAHREAIRFLTVARDAATAVGLPLDASFHSALAASYEHTVQFDLAIAAYSEAIARENQPLKRAALHAQLAFVHNSRNDRHGAWEQILAGLSAANRPWPRSRVGALLRGVWNFTLGHLSRFTRIGYGTAVGSNREMHEVTRKLLYVGAYEAFVALDVPRFMSVTLGALWSAARLGVTVGAAESIFNVATAVAAMGLRKLAFVYNREGRRLADQLADRQLLEMVPFSDSLVSELTGDLPERFVPQAESSLARSKRWVPPNVWQKHALILRSHYLLRGRMEDVVRLGEQLHELSPNEPLDYSVPALAALGRAREASDLSLDMKRRLHERPHAPMYVATHAACETGRHLFNGNLGADFDQSCAEFEALKISPLTAPAFIRCFFVFRGWGRLAQAVRATPDQRPATRQALRRAMRELMFTATTTPLRTHLNLLRGNLAWLSARHDDAWAIAARVEASAATYDNPWAAFEVARLKGRILLAQGRSAAAEREVRRAVTLANDHRWVGWMHELDREFGVLARTSSTGLAGATGSSHGGATAVHASSSGAGDRRLEALLRVIHASESIVDVGELASVAAREAASIMGAERAFLLLAERETGALKVVASHSEDKEAAGYSRTVVERVEKTRQPFVSTLTSEGDVLSSESSVARGLRSVIAAPLMSGEVLRGIMYLDSSLIRGLFTEGDVEILVALASQVAAALETARVAGLQAERAALQKDLSLTGAVQSLLMPHLASREVHGAALAGVSRSADQSGGDWWWYEDTPSGVAILVADVSGHGVSSAMVTATIVGVYHALRRSRPEAPLKEILGDVASLFHRLYGTTFSMVMGAVELDVTTGAATVWNAGLPPPLLLRRAGALEVLTKAHGALIGPDATFPFGVASVALEPGDRLALLTDGMPEATRAGGRPLGPKAVARLLQDAKAMREPAAARDEMLRGFDAVRDRSVPQADDVTLVVLDRH